MAKSKHFSEGEKRNLRYLVLKYKDAIESKELDNVSSSMKKAAWDAIMEEFNSNTENNSRTTEQLRKVWENIKFRRKTEIASQKKHSVKSGERSCSPTSADTELAIYGSDIQLKDAVDSDTTFQQERDVLPSDIVECVVLGDKVKKGEGYGRPPSSVNQLNASVLKSEPTAKKNISQVENFSTEAEISRERAKYQINLERHLGEMQKEEQRLKIDLLKQNLVTAKEEEAFQKQRRALELDILRRKLEKVKDN